MKRKVVPMKAIVESEWFKSLPLGVQQAVRTRPPGWYVLKSTGQEVLIYSYEVDKHGKCSTCKVIVETGYNIGFKVFGVPLTDLKPLVIPKGASR